MTEHPTATDIDDPNVSGTRPIASYDVSPIARGGQALAFAVEPFVDVWAQAQPLTRPHYDEIAKNKELLKLNPDLEKYELLDRSGNLLLITARADGRLVGYFLWIIAPHPH
jgi:hypothetical protein